MENTLGQSPSIKNEDKNLNLNADAAVISSVKNEIFKLNNEVDCKENLILRNTEALRKCESPECSKESTEKVSPALFESAIKVIKILFSPEKAKNKTTNSVNECKNVSESSSGPLQSKQKLISETEVSLMKSPFTEENGLKDKKQLIVPMLSPPVFDLQNNNDDSFITTLSYDESFQSAVTHIDDNGEVTKSCDNLSNSIFNNSQDLNLAESCSSFLENSECCLENTMLKNDSFSSKEINDNGFSMKNTNGNNEAFNNVKNFEHNDVGVPNIDCHNPAPAVQIEIIEANHLDGYTHISNNLLGISDLSGGLPAMNGVSNDSTQCSIINSECVKSIQERKIVCPENRDLDFVEMKEIEADKSPVIAAENPILQSPATTSSSFHFSPLSKSDSNEVEEMLLTLKKDSGTFTSLNFLEGNDVVLPNIRNASFKESSDFIDTNQSPMKNLENSKSERAESVNKSRSDKCEEFLPQKIFEKGSVETKVPEKAEYVETEKECQNELKTSHAFDLKINHEKVGFNDKELIEKSCTSPASILTKNVTVLLNNKKLKLAVPNSLFSVSESISLDATPSNFTCSEITENDLEGTKLFVEEAACKFSLKHSTPVSASRNDNVCSSPEQEATNSLETNEGRNDKIVSEVHSTKSDFLEKAMRIFCNGDQSSLLDKNLSDSDPLLSVKSIGSGSWIEPLKLPNEISEASLVNYKRNKPKAPTQILKENSKSPSSELNPAGKTKNDSVCQKEGEKPECEEIFCNTSASFDSENSDLSKTVDVREHAKLNQSKNSEVSMPMNKTYDKMPDNGEPSKLNLTFNKKTDATKSTKNKVNSSYVKESIRGGDLECDVNNVKNVSENKVPLEFVNGKERSEILGSQEGDNFLSPLKECSESICRTFHPCAKENLTKKINAINVDGTYFKGKKGFSASPPSTNTTIKNQIFALNNSVKESFHEKIMLSESGQPNIVNFETISSELSPLCESMEPDVAQLIEQQFTPTDIARICDIANLPENLNNLSLKAKEGEAEKVKNVLSPKSFDFLNSIQGKPTGRDLSRESLYVKFDPLVQPPTANSLIDFTKEVEAPAATETSQADRGSNVCEELLAISPEKKSDAIVPPLTPLSDRNKKDKLERQKELQNEIYFLKNLYSERERINKTKMEEYENQIAKLTGDRCVLEDKLKGFAERERSLVNKMMAQTHDIEQLNIVMKEYVKVISLLTVELETIRKDSAKQIEVLTAEKESYMNHLQNTEAAFSDVHTKYEKSKKTIESLKQNEVMYKTTISEHAQKMEEYKKKAKEAQEKALDEFQNIMLQLHESKNSHSQEVSRLRAQLKKTELKLEAVQESLDQKLKENQQLTAICDELIEGKK